MSYREENGQVVQCSAHPGQTGRQCRARKGLTKVLVAPNATGGSALVLPTYVVINLCPKHFVFKEPLR
jgi:hypothetical protein